MTGRRFGLLALVAVVCVLVAQLVGLGQVDERLDGTSLLLLALALLIGVVLMAPGAVEDLLDRVSLVRFGQFELRLGATSRAERVQALQLEAIDEVSVKPRPRAESPRAEYVLVRGSLERKLRWVGRNVLELTGPVDVGRAVAAIEAERLLSDDELGLTRDLLGSMEEEVEKLPRALREEYLDSAWRFTRRFRTLAFERLVRRKMTQDGWSIFDFTQSANHRPDFLAFFEDTSLMIATRVNPKDTETVRGRLAGVRPPFGAEAVVVVPDTQEIEGEYAGGVLHLSDAIAYRGEPDRRRPG